MRRAIVMVVVVILAGTAVFAQEKMEPKKWDRLDWYRIVQIKFKPGELDQAKKIIDQYFVEASKKAGTSPVMAFMHHSGEWDMTIIWKMKGIDDLEWQTSPSDVAWMNALASETGGMDKAMEVWQEYTSHVDRTNETIARGWDPVPDDH